MAAVQKACSRCSLMEIDELRADTSHLLKNHCPNNKSNISKEEYKVIKELREDKTRVVLTADKGMAMVVRTNRTTWTKLSHYSQTPAPITPSARTHLPDLGTEKSLHLRTLNNKVDLVTQHTGNCIPLMLSPPSFIAFPKTTKQAPPPISIMSSGGSITYEVVIELAGIIHPLVGQSPHHIRNTQHFVQHIQHAKLEPGRSWHPMMSIFFSLLFLWTLPYK